MKKGDLVKCSKCDSQASYSVKKHGVTEYLCGYHYNQHCRDSVNKWLNEE
jgi:hypothetical protein